MLASTLEKSEFLISPNFSYPNAQKSVLIKYQENGIKIATSTVLSIYKPKNTTQPINERIFNWMLQACGYSLRINDQKNNNSFFQKAMILYLDWLKDFPFICREELRENYIRIMMLHLSQIFVNPSFDDKICYIFINKIRSAFINKKQQLSIDTWLTIIKVVLYGNSELLKLKMLNIEESTKIEFSKVSLDLLYKCEVYQNDDFWSQFDEQLNDLFKHQLFCSSWITKFSELYILRLQKNHELLSESNDLSYLNFVIQFYKKKIDSEFNEINKQKAFTAIVYSWNLFSKENASLLHERWNIKEIKEMILPWFSINIEWKRDSEVNDIHPLFLLLQMGEGQLFNQKDKQLEEIATQIIKKALSDKSKNDLYWFFPQYSYFFLVKNPQLLKEIKEYFVDYVYSFKNSEYSTNVKLNIYVCFILMLLIEQEKDNPKAVNSLSQLLIPKTTDFTVFLVSLICLLLTKNSEHFWMMYNNGLNLHEFDDVVDVLSLISCLSPHLNGSDFVNNVSINNNIWNFLYSPQSIYYRERLILSFYFLSEGSDYFVVNPDDGASLIQYFLVKSADTKTFPVLSNFYKMTRLSILCGGALNSSEPSDDIDIVNQTSQKPTENFMTKSYIVSVIDDNHIKIRHGLGSTIFSVDDSITLFNDDDDNDDGSEYTPQTNDQNEILFEYSPSYVSKCEPASELLEAVERMDSLFLSNSDFIPYSPNQSGKNVSPAHSFLCDTGFISSFSEKNIRRVPFSSMANSIEAKLDKLEPIPKIKVPIIQVKEDSTLFSNQTECLKKLIEIDLKKVQTKISTIEFITATENNDITSLLNSIEKYGFCILLNEGNLLLNHSNKIINANVIISLIQDKNYYIVDIMMSKNFGGLKNTAKRELFGKHKFEDLSFVVPNELIANFIALVVVIFYSSTPIENEKNDENEDAEKKKNESPVELNQKGNDVDEQILGPELFVSGFKKRMNAIYSEFEKSNQGKMPLLIEISQEK